MGLDAVIRAGLRAVDRVTGKGLQGTVTHRPWVGQDAYGKATLGDEVRISALIYQTEGERVTATGRMLHVTAIVTVPRPQDFAQTLDQQQYPDLEFGEATARTNPFDIRDRITLPDGSTGPIVRIVSGLADPSTGRPYFTELWIG